MSGPAVRRYLSFFVLSVALLPWVVASRSGEGGGRAPVAPERPTAIASLSSVAAVASDRPTVPISFKRADGVRVPLAAPAGRSSLHVPLGLDRLPTIPNPIVGSQVLALHLAGRGPPLPVAG